MFPNNERDERSRGRIQAAAVHLFTAAGSVIGLLGFAACSQGELRTVHILMLLTVLIDSADGSLARKFRVREVLPQIDGALMDNLVDFVNYSMLPAYVLLSTDLLPDNFRLPGAALVLFSSCYQFSHTNAKTKDHYFRGFPSYWNLLVIYLSLLGSSPWTNSAVVATCAVMAFVPIYYVYPSRTRALRKLTLWLSLPWVILLFTAVLITGVSTFDRYSYPLTVLSLFYIVYYLALSFFLTFQRIKSGNEHLD